MPSQPYSLFSGLHGTVNQLLSEKRIVFNIDGECFHNKFCCCFLRHSAFFKISQREFLLKFHPLSKSL